MRTKKTIATITYHRSDNFGSVLQAYALTEVLEQMGYSPFVIDYRKKEVARMYRILQPPVNKFNCITDCYHLLHYPALKRRQRRYEAFRRQWLPTGEVYTTKQALMAQPPKADAYITGSDQVWNTPIVDFDESYLLDFVKEGKKLSYAASGIRKDMDAAALAPVRAAIGSFDGVSVRENIAKTRLEDLCPVTVCIDPVLLLQKQDWERVCVETNRKKPYMLCYFAGNVSAAFEAFTRQKAKQLGLERVILMPEWRNLFRPGTGCYDAGPAEFVSLIRDAALVCTNSFHGTAFSVLLNRPFLVGQAVPFADDRLGTFLSTVGLSEREIDPASDVCPEKLTQIDFAHANAVLETLRQRDMGWLRRHIEGGCL